MKPEEIVKLLQPVVTSLNYIIRRLNKSDYISTNQKLKVLAIRQQMSRFNQLNKEDFPLVQEILTDYLQRLE